MKRLTFITLCSVLFALCATGQFSRSIAFKAASTGGSSTNGGGGSTPTNTTDHLVAWWKMDDANGNSSYLDSAGANNGGGPVVSVSGIISNAAHLDGAAEIPVSAGYTYSALSFSVWVKPESFANEGGIAPRVMFQSDSGDNYENDLGLANNGSVNWNGYSGSGYLWKVNGGSITTNAWHYLVATYDGANARLYVDGSQVTSTNYGSGSFGTFTVLNIGRLTTPASPTGAHYTGAIDDARVYSKALSAGEVTNQYLWRGP